ncbi:class I adenylate-forming enzyme family protein [Streptomyces niveiscabiei]|uniref:class I adenylate-forming enzyme family protein n=1 Tax=Streptomyces niveiscabiei TaxID=164115 RepID=UPI0029B12228|nr:class I adenylate-forming enzyme family protein [Streptomyces niveiscabiei]MDX3382446.1 class I adenylate-forming enzyme family protein [Streptomyces niveiscabiei]
MSTASDVPATLAELLDSAARDAPHAVALRGEDAVLTYGELRRRVWAAARRFRSCGLTGHGTTGLLLENTPDCAVAFLAAARLGLRLVPLEPGVSRERLLAVRDEAGSLSVVGRSAQLSTLEGSGCLLVPVEFPAGPPDDAADAADEEPSSPPAPDAAFLHQYTSGSTGEPKQAVHTQRNLVHGGDIYTRAYGITGEDRILLAVPLPHSFGTVAGLVTALHARAQLVLLGRFTPARLLRALEEHACTVLVGAPMVYDLVIRAAPSSARPSYALRLCLSSGAALPPEVARRAEEQLGTAVRQVYGCTEAGVIAAQRPGEPGVGRPMPGVRVRVVDEQGHDVPRGEAGALLVRTPAMFTHYLGHPEATRRAFLDGWYRTGDVARLGPEGHLCLVGRKDTFVNVGGRKVNPLEVEEVLLAHPAVVEAVVWGEASDSAGERVRAAVVARGPLDATELASHCRARLLPYQVPAEVRFVASLPKNSLGKVRRAAAPGLPAVGT